MSSHRNVILLPHRHPAMGSIYPENCNHTWNKTRLVTWWSWLEAFCLVYLPTAAKRINKNQWKNLNFFFLAQKRLKWWKITKNEEKYKKNYSNIFLYKQKSMKKSKFLFSCSEPLKMMKNYQKWGEIQKKVFQHILV